MALNTLLAISMRMAARIPGKHATASVRRRRVPPGKGLGAFARPNISLGTLILSEKPLFKVPSLVQHAECVQNVGAQSLCALDKEQQRRFLELSNNFPQLHVFMGIVKTSGIPLGVDAREGGIFPTFSRVNHSCVANAVYSWNGKLGEESLYAVKTIRDKEEIIANYSRGAYLVCPEKSQTGPNQSRLWILCYCQICNGSVDSVGCSDHRCIEPHRLELLSAMVS